MAKEVYTTFTSKFMLNGIFKRWSFLGICVEEGIVHMASYLYIVSIFFTEVSVNSEKSEWKFFSCAYTLCYGNMDTASD